MLFATVSMALLFGIAAFALVRDGRQVKLGAALILWLSGFTAASTGIAPYVIGALTAIVHAFQSVH